MANDTTMSGEFVIRTGVPSLDALFRSSSRSAGKQAAPERCEGFSLDAMNEASSICIAGPDGTGKSVLAMHFGARYAADSHAYCGRSRLEDPRFFYVSSDLSFIKADSMWRGFALHKPNARLVPFRTTSCQDDWSGKSADPAYELLLTEHAPNDLELLAAYVQGKTDRPQFAFIDLAAHTAGDDWAFLERLIASLPRADGMSPRHLLVVDAMEGIEAFAGDVDAFGEKTTRRGRVAKLMRLAAEKCHLVLVVEEPADGTRLAEQFVADVVVRLRSTENQGYSRRTIEIEKARGQLHVRGRHPYTIRDGRGSTTGEQDNVDDPVVKNDAGFQSYIDVYPSLHSLASAVIRSHGAGRESRSDLRAGFGIRELDEMLADEVPERKPDRGDGQDPHGLPCGTVSALIGDANTQKSFLGVSFLGHMFHELAWRAATWKRSTTRRVDRRESEYYRSHFREGCDPSSEWAKRLLAVGADSGAVVLVTTKDENSRTLADRFLAQVKEETTRRAKACGLSALVQARWNNERFREALRAYIQSRIICRRLEVHDMPSPVLFHEIRRSIEAAQQLIGKGYVNVCLGWPQPEPNQRAPQGWRVRFVLDDFNSVMRTYRLVHDDPLFLPFLLLTLRREGLSSLIIETQAGMHGTPALALGDVQAELRALSDHRLYTWHVPDFFGDHRIAIAAIPPLVKRDLKSPVLVRELEWLQPNSGSLPRVNPRFELYAGLDTNKPTLVPLRVHLYAKTPAWESYITRLDEIWKRVFDSPTPEDEHERRSVIFAEKAENYDVMREACELHANTNLSYSLIIQIDEFWHHAETFRPQYRYFNSAPEAAADGRLRAEGFDSVYKLPGDKPDRIPFVFDFGFLACRERAWDEATRDVKQPKEELEKDRKNASRVWAKMKTGEPYSWAAFMKAASYVARADGAQQSRPVPAFDIAMVVPQTFSCLVLEMWFSEIRLKYTAVGERLASLMNHRQRGAVPEWSLPNLVKRYWKQLYRAWLLLVECLDLGSFGTRKEGFGFEFARKADPKAVATRHWYKTASLLGSERSESETMRFCRLPGSFSVRGDWFLAGVRGSRSDRLVDRALDLLCTPEANVDRLIRGLALPTRQIGDEKSLSTRLHGWHKSARTHGTLTYADVLQLGPTGNPDFHWLWRGNLTNYHAAAPIWERWLYRVLRRWMRTREYFGSEWISGFEAYSKVYTSPKELQKRTVSFGDFRLMCDRLCGEMKEAGITGAEKAGPADEA